MFNTLESTWDQSARRGRATLASFSIQAFSLGLVIAISVLWVERPPQVRWVQLTAPMFSPAQPEVVPAHPATSSGLSGTHAGIVAPILVPRETRRSNTLSGIDVTEAPAIDDFARTSANPMAGINHGLGNGIPIVIPSHPAPTKPLPVSNWAEGAIVYRVQPVYPPLAKQARIQGTVELRAIISRNGAIENLTVLSGHPMLVRSAIEAVRQWRYRPYLLNGDPVEVETSVTVDFILSGN